MARLIALVAVLFIFAGAALADSTWVSDSLISGNWTAAGSPYMIYQRDVTVGAGQTLAIGPGVTVYFAGPYRFVVHGTLQAQGAEGDSIYFTTDTLANPSHWRGVRFLSADSACVMNYCVVEFGSASGPADNRYGGGIEVQTCSPSFNHTTIRYCMALLDGGGVYVRDLAHPVFTDCEISQCHSTMGDGGGLFSRISSVRLTRCLSRGNSVSTSGNYGGGIGMISPVDSSLLDGCVIEHNRAASGGGVYIRNRNFSTRLQGSILRDNWAARGGAVFDSVAQLNVVNCDFYRNSADSGAAVYSTNAWPLRINFSTFSANYGAVGMLYSRHDTLSVTNSIYAFNPLGPGITLRLPGPLTLHHNNLFGNFRGSFAGDVPSGLGSLTRDNVWGDSCDSQSNLSVDPCFADTVAGNFHLADSSRCLAAGDDLLRHVREDQEHLVRPLPAGSYPDLGAHERELASPEPCLVGGLSGTVGPGEVLIGGNVSVAEGDTLVILPGTRLTFTGPYYFRVYGVLSAPGTATDSIIFTTDTVANPVRWQTLQFVSTAGCSLAYCRLSYSKAYYLNSPCGLHITGGSMPVVHCVFENSTWPYAVGCGADSTRFSNCEFRGNRCRSVSGTGSHASFTDCTFRNNPYGAAVFEGQSQPTFLRCNFLSNTCSYADAAPGTAVYFNGAGGSMTDCNFVGNQTSGGDGGAVRLLFSNTVFRKCIFRGNLAGEGGAVSIYSGAPDFERCTFVDNVETRQTAYGGIVIYWESAGQFRSNIISGSTGRGLFVQNSPSAQIHACDVFGSTAGNIGTYGPAPAGLGQMNHTNRRGDPCDLYENVCLPPGFVDPANGDFQLAEPSRCINAGDSSLPHDPDGTVADIGAFYFYTVGTPPQPFHLLTPEAGMILAQDTLIAFTWEASADTDSWDRVDYTLHLAAGDTALTVPDLYSPAITLNLHGLAIPSGVEVRWFVTAHSSFPETSVCSDTLRFTLDLPDAASSGAVIPREFALHGAAPNPFNPATRMAYDLPRAGAVRLRIFDVLGREVAVLADGPQRAGSYVAVWNAAAYPSGMYFAVLESGSQRRLQKLMLLK